MLSKLREAEEKYLNLEASLSNPTVMADPDRYVTVMKEYKALTPVIEAFRAYQSALKASEEALAILSDTSDPELRALADEELKEAKERSEALYRDLTVLLLPRDPNDEKNVIVEIRAGAGGEEAALFAAVLYRMYTMYATASGFRFTVMNQNPTELGGYREIVFQVEGDGAYSRFKFESGVHRVQRVPETESQGRIQTSTATVAVLPEVEEVSVDLNPADVIMETCKSSGAGGQHINKTDSAIRIVHKPTGIVVGCQTERSQLQNKETAMKMLKSKLMEIKMREKLERIEDIQGNKANIEWGSQIRSYVFMPYTLAKDTRTGYEDGNIDAVMDGEIDGFINAYLKHISKEENK